MTKLDVRGDLYLGGTPENLRIPTKIASVKGLTGALQRVNISN